MLFPSFLLLTGTQVEPNHVTLTDHNAPRRRSEESLMEHQVDQAEVRWTRLEGWMVRCFLMDQFHVPKSLDRVVPTWPDPYQESKIGANVGTPRDSNP